MAIDDINMRNEAMREELNKDKRDENPGSNQNLMRIIQGGVMPQVNGGVLEVARVFLAEAEEDYDQYAIAVDDKAPGAGVAEQLRTELQSCVVEFLQLAKELLVKAKAVLVLDVRLLTAQVDPNEDDSAAKLQALLKKKQQDHENNVVWLKEMEKGYEGLVRAMGMYLDGIPRFAVLAKEVLPADGGGHGHHHNYNVAVRARGTSFSPRHAPLR